MVTFFWQGSDLCQSRNRDRDAGACGAGGWLISIPQAPISSVLMCRRLAAMSVKLLYLSLCVCLYTPAETHSWDQHTSRSECVQRDEEVEESVELL